MVVVHTATLTSQKDLSRLLQSASTFAGVRSSVSSFLFSHSIVCTIFTCVVGSWSAVVTGTEEEDDDTGAGYWKDVRFVTLVCSVVSMGSVNENCFTTTFGKEERRNRQRFICFVTRWGRNF